MTRSEAAKLLAFCAAYDQRTIGEADVLAWTEALESPWVPNIDLDEAQQAVVAHYQETTQRVGVADILKRVKAWRAEQLTGRVPPKQPGRPPTEEYQKARAEWEAREHPYGFRRQRPDGVA
jgi:hypothetical protein